MPKISIIIPVYKVEHYLTACVDSVLAQTFRDIEIILVDDGSPDNCGKICDAYTEKDPRVVVIHKENGGLSSARNSGIERSTGEFVGFVDSDDYIAEDMYEVLYQNIVSTQADIASCGIYNVYENCCTRSCSQEVSLVCNDHEFLGYLLKGELVPGSICNKLIRRSVLSTLRFPVGRLYEDAFFHAMLMPHLHTAFITTSPKYYYRHRCNSITTHTYRKSDLDIIDAYRMTLELVQKEYPEWLSLAEFRLFWAHFIVLGLMVKQEDYKHLDDFPYVSSFLKKRIGSVLRNPHFTFKRKLSAIALKINTKLFRILYQLENKRLLVAETNHHTEP